jgi:hypothetical protein
MCRQISVTTPHTKLHENWSRRRRYDACGYNEANTRFSHANAPKTDLERNSAKKKKKGLKSLQALRFQRRDEEFHSASEFLVHLPSKLNKGRTRGISLTSPKYWGGGKEVVRDYAEVSLHRQRGNPQQACISSGRPTLPPPPARRVLFTRITIDPACAHACR